MKLKLAASILALGLFTLLGACQSGSESEFPSETEPGVDSEAPTTEETIPSDDMSSPEVTDELPPPDTPEGMPESDTPEGVPDPDNPQEPQVTPEG